MSSFPMWTQGKCFNSRSRVGSDASPVRVVPTVLEFQFTLPRGERLAKVCTI